MMTPREMRDEQHDKLNYPSHNRTWACQLYKQSLSSRNMSGFETCLISESAVNVLWEKQTERRKEKLLTPPSAADQTKRQKERLRAGRRLLFHIVKYYLFFRGHMPHERENIFVPGIPV